MALKGIKFLPHYFESYVWNHFLYIFVKIVVWLIVINVVSSPPIKNDVGDQVGDALLLRLPN